MKLFTIRVFLLSVIFLVALVTLSCSSQSNQESLHHDENNPLLLISFDGFMNEYLERNETPNFDNLIRNGVKAEYMVPIFPTKTFPNHYTIATGLYAENHGIIANSFYDPKLDANFSYGPVDTPNDERWWGGEPVWITAEKQGLTTASFFWQGSGADFNGVQSTKWMEYDGSIPDKARIDSMMTWMDPNGAVQADFGSLYFSFIDEIGHDYGPNSAEIDSAVQRADSLLGYLMDEMEKYELAGQLNLIITSDHGMAELSPERVIFLDDMINLEDVEIIDWTPVALIQPEKDDIDSIYTALKKNEKHYRVFLKENIPGHFHFSDHYRIPEIVMIANVGYTITTRDYFKEDELKAGAHGFDYRRPEMRTIFIANGPDFVSGEISPPFQSVHIYEMMCKILGITPAENNGNIMDVEHMLRK